MTSNSSSHLALVWIYQIQPQTQSCISQDNKGRVSVKGSFPAVTVDQTRMPPEPGTVQLMTTHAVTVAGKITLQKCDALPPPGRMHTLPVVHPP